METVELVVKIATAIVAIWGAIKLVPKAYHWVRSWKIVKREEFERLQTLETKHQECEKERVRNVDVTAKAVHAALERLRRPETKVESEFDPRVPF